MLNYMLTWDNNGKIARTRNFLNRVPQWEDISGLFLGKVVDAALDLYSEYITSGFITGKMGAYVVAVDGNTLRIYYIQDLTASTLIRNQQFAWTGADESTEVGARIAVSESENRVLVNWRARSQSYQYYLRERVENIWSSIKEIGVPLTYVDDLNDDALIGAAYHQDYMLPSSFNVYHSPRRFAGVNSDIGQIASSIRHSKPLPVVSSDNQGTVYIASRYEPASTKVVTFESGGYPHYTYNVVDHFAPGADPEQPLTDTSTDLTKSINGGAAYAIGHDIGTLPGRWHSLGVRVDLGGMYQFAAITASVKVKSSDWLDGTGRFAAIINTRNSRLQFVGESYPLLLYEENDDQWLELSLTTQVGVNRFVEIWVNPNIGGGAHFGSNTTIEMWIDNITIQCIENPSKLWRVSNFPAPNQVVTDISPATNYALPTPYSLCIDRNNKDRLVVIAESPQGQRKLFESLDQGSSWNDLGNTEFFGLKSSDSSLLLFGQGALVYSPGCDFPLTDKFSNLSSIFGSSAIIRGTVDNVWAYKDQLGPEHEKHLCPVNFEAAERVFSDPVGMRSGEKYEEMTDLSIATSAGRLEFTRTYRQSKRSNAYYQFMGRGWTHNHQIHLSEDTTVTPNKIIVRMGGSETHFNKSGTVPNYYEATSGSNSFIDINTSDPSSRYTLTNSDGTIYIFEQLGNGGRLTTRTWPFNRSWTYAYDAQDRLDYVQGDDFDLDGFGLTRKLTFTYYTSGDHSGQLYRVTDHSGRYVEFTYTRPKIESGGQIVDDTVGSLLNTVRDVRGNNWTYKHYGQSSGETETGKLNLLTQVVSPSVNGSPIVIKDVSYTLDGTDVVDVTEDLGIVDTSDPLLSMKITFPTESANVTTEEIAGISRKIRYAGEVMAGVEDPKGNYGFRLLNDVYRPRIQVDPNGNTTSMLWSDTGKHLEQVIDPLGASTAFEYDDDLLANSMDAEGRKTEYTYNNSNNPRQPTLIEILEPGGTTVLRRQETAIGSQPHELGMITSEKSVDPSNSSTISETTRSYYSSGLGHGLLQTVTQVDPTGIANNTWTTYEYDALGRVTKTTKSSMLGSCDVSFTVYDDADNVVAQICNYDLSYPSGSSYSAPTDAASARQLRQQTLQAIEQKLLIDPTFVPNYAKNRVTIYEFDTLGRRVQVLNNAGDANEQATYTVYDALSRVRLSISNYKPASYAPPYLWRWESNTWKDDAAGDEIAHGADNDENIIQESVFNERGQVRLTRDVLGRVTLYGYDEADHLVKTIVNAAQSDYDNSYAGDADLSDYGTPVAAPDTDIISESLYDRAGNVIKTTDPLGRVNFSVYDELNRVVKAVRSASDPDYDIYNEPRLSGYTYQPDVSLDIVTSTVYDIMGRTEATYDASGEATRQIYDDLGRNVRTIRNYIPQLNSVGDVVDPAQWQWNDSAGDWEYLYSGSSTYQLVNHDSDAPAGKTNDQNIISATIYNSKGYVQFTRDPLGRRTWVVYDGLGRQVKTVTNYSEQGTAPEDWVWREVSGAWAWRLSNSNDNPVDFGINQDQNAISETHYDTDGRVDWTRDSLGRQTYNVYDVLGRQVKTVTNFLALATTPDQWVWRDVGSVLAWRLSATNDTLVHTDPTKSDENVITETVYDDQGRVQYTRNNQGNVTYNVYTVHGRQRMTITNYLPLTETPDQWVWRDVSGVWAWRQSDTNDALVTHGADNDQNIFTATEETDILGRVLSVRDHVGIETRYSYDALGRRIQTITNYVDGSFNPANPDEDLISLTAYNKAGQVVTTTDVRGTETAFTYDAAGRRLTVIQAANTGLATTSYTCYDKSGRTLRMIQNYTPDGTTSPDAKDEMGVWLFDPDTHGINNDRNLITEYIYDALGRQISVIDPLKNERETAYFIDGQVRAITEKGVAIRGTEEDVMTQYRYDRLRRRRMVVQAFLDDSYADVENWYPYQAPTPPEEEPPAPVWKDGGNPDKLIAHNDGTQSDNDEYNIIVQVAYDIAGRMISRYNPRGYATTYQYDLLDRRKALTNPLPDPKTWTTVYKLLTDGKTQTELTDPKTVVTTRGFDRLGRPTAITYGDPTTTPDVTFAYDVAGNRQTMSEFGGASFTNKVRETSFTYDATRRMTSAGFDTDGDNTVDETVSYEHEAGGQRTKLTMPGNLSVIYTYNAKGQLVSLTDWDDQRTRFSYDAAGHHTATERANGFTTRYKYDAGGRLRLLRHTQGKRTLGHFAYEVDRRGNRTHVLEALAHPQDSIDTEYLYDDSSIIYAGTWTNAAPFKQTTSPSAALRLLVFGSQMTLRIGTGPDHSIFDVYIGKSLWESFDGYAASSGTRDISVQLDGKGPFLFEIRNRRERNSSAAVSANYTLRFEKFTVIDTTYTLQTLSYKYDPVSRVIEAEYRAGDNLGATPFRTYEYAYDTAGNRLSETIDSVATTYTYNAANQITNSGFAYDNNGNLTNDGSNIHTWDRANRLLSMGGHNYKYTGDSNRIQQTVDSIVTNYLLDVQPSLVYVLSANDASNTDHYVHSPRGIQAQHSSTHGWQYMVTDGLHSVRSVLTDTSSIVETTHYSPYGVPETPISLTGWAFTGEWRDENELQYHRARYYSTNFAQFQTLDVFEGNTEEPTSLNGYIYALSNPINLTDSSGYSADYFDIHNTLKNNYLLEMGVSLAPRTELLPGAELLNLINKINQCGVAYDVFQFARIGNNFARQGIELPPVSDDVLNIIGIAAGVTAGLALVAGTAGALGFGLAGFSAAGLLTFAGSLANFSTAMTFLGIGLKIYNGYWYTLHGEYARASTYWQGASLDLLLFGAGYSIGTYLGNASKLGTNSLMTTAKQLQAETELWQEILKFAIGNLLSTAQLVVTLEQYASSADQLAEAREQFGYEEYREAANFASLAIYNEFDPLSSDEYLEAQDILQKSCQILRTRDHIMDHGPCLSVPVPKF